MTAMKMMLQRCRWCINYDYHINYQFNISRKWLSLQSDFYPENGWTAEIYSQTVTIIITIIISIIIIIVIITVIVIITIIINNTIIIDTNITTLSPSHHSRYDQVNHNDLASIDQLNIGFDQLQEQGTLREVIITSHHHAWSSPSSPSWYSNDPRFILGGPNWRLTLVRRKIFRTGENLPTSKISPIFSQIFSSRLKGQGLSTDLIAIRNTQWIIANHHH